MKTGTLIDLEFVLKFFGASDRAPRVSLEPTTVCRRLAASIPGLVLDTSKNGNLASR